MQTHTLLRTGKTPLRFTGELIGQATEPLSPVLADEVIAKRHRQHVQSGGLLTPEEFARRERAKRILRHYHPMCLYRTNSGKFVLHIMLRSEREEQIPFDTVIVCEDQAAVLRALEEYDPLELIEDYPDLPDFNDKQAVLEQRTRDEYDNRVALLLASAEIVEEV